LPGGPRRSPTWDTLYQGFKRGEHLALPYFATRATDPIKQAALSDAYQRYRAQQLDPRALPDLADIYPDDPQTRAEIGLQTEPLATPAETLIQACGSCHNDVLDQTVSRARFNIDLARLTPAERELAIVRLEANSESSEVMPPHETRQLAAGARDALVAYLRSDTRPVADDALLAHAAKLGMAVITKPNMMPY
jgi:mono/diheme cytochrome c family protein